MTEVETPRGVSTPAVHDYSTQYAYDLLDRPRVETANGVSKSRLTHYCFDAAGDLRSITAPRDAATVACGANGAPAGTAFTERHEYTAAHELGRSSTRAATRRRRPTTSTATRRGDRRRGREGHQRPMTAATCGPVVEDFESGPPPRRHHQGRLRRRRHPRSTSIRRARSRRPAGTRRRARTTSPPPTTTASTARPELLPKRRQRDPALHPPALRHNGNLTHLTVPVTEASLGRSSATGRDQEVGHQLRALRPGLDPLEQGPGPAVDYDYAAEGWQSSRKPAARSREHRDTFRTYYRDGLLRTFRRRERQPRPAHYDRNGNTTFLRDAGVTSSAGRSLDIDHNGFDEVSATTASEENRNRKIDDLHVCPDGLLKTRADDREESQAGTLVRAARRTEFATTPTAADPARDFGRSSGRDDDKRITQS